MENKTSKDRQRKFYLVLPLIVLPFLALLFWVLGGGNNADAQQSAMKQSGLNTALPAAHLKADSTANKLSFYMQAEKDSLKDQQARRDDPYYKDTLKSNPGSFNAGFDAPTGTQYVNAERMYAPPSLNTTTVSLNQNEQRIRQQLAAINRQVNQPAPDYTRQNDLTSAQANIQSISNTPDPQMQQISQMLDKIQEIQNPGLALQKLKEQSLKNRGQVFTVSNFKKELPVSTLESNFTTTGNGFFGTDNNKGDTTTQNAIAAVIAETQTVTAGSSVKFRLLNDIFINGRLIPKDNYVYGIASLSGERLNVRIADIGYHHSIFPVDLSAYDIDGAEGIYIPGAITRDVAKESADQGMQNIGLTSYDPSLGAQAATAGIAAARNLLSRKVRLVKVTLKAGYQVLLLDEKQKQMN